MLERVDATSLDASTVNGDVGYDGPVRSGGRYALSSHNGDVTLAVAESASATVSVSTFSGEFESDFPVTAPGDPEGQAVQLHARRRRARRCRSNRSRERFGWCGRASSGDRARTTTTETTTTTRDTMGPTIGS